jgi:hypothetical protein
MAQDFYPRVSLISSEGEHIRYVPGPLAQALVQGGSATKTAPETTGKIRSVTLAQNPAIRIGEPTQSTSMSVRFTRWRRLDVSGTRIVEHHPRCTYE